MFGCDFTKAFDTVRWELIFQALSWFGFGQKFIAVIRTLFNDIETCIFNNGFTSRYFRPTMGVRQGCCISPYLFLLVAEVLVIQIREDKHIKGIKVNDVEYRLTQYADDLTGFAADKETLQCMVSLIQDFKNLSGLALNTKKISNHGNRPQHTFGTTDSEYQLSLDI